MQGLELHLSCSELIEAWNTPSPSLPNWKLCEMVSLV